MFSSHSISSNLLTSCSSDIPSILNLHSLSFSSFFIYWSTTPNPSLHPPLFSLHSISISSHSAVSLSPHFFFPPLYFLLLFLSHSNSSSPHSYSLLAPQILSPFFIILLFDPSLPSSFSSPHNSSLPSSSHFSLSPSLITPFSLHILPLHLLILFLLLLLLLLHLLSLLPSLLLILPSPAILSDSPFLPFHHHHHLLLLSSLLPFIFTHPPLSS